MKQKACEWIFLNLIPFWFTRYELTDRIYMWFAINGYGDTGQDADPDEDCSALPF